MMEVKEVTHPTNRTFQLTVNEYELNVIKNSLLALPSDCSTRASTIFCMVDAIKKAIKKIPRKVPANLEKAGFFYCSFY